MANLYIKGVDISGYQPNVDFNAVKNDGVEVCIIKATESTIYPNSAFDYQVNGCINNGITTAEISSIINSSATLPPRERIMDSNISLRERHIVSSTGTLTVTPPAFPDGTIVIILTGSVCSQ